MDQMIPSTIYYLFIFCFWYSYYIYFLKNKLNKLEKVLKWSDYKKNGKMSFSMIIFSKPSFCKNVKIGSSSVHFEHDNSSSNDKIHVTLSHLASDFQPPPDKPPPDNNPSQLLHYMPIFSVKELPTTFLLLTVLLNRAFLLDATLSSDSACQGKANMRIHSILNVWSKLICFVCSWVTHFQMK